MNGNFATTTAMLMAGRPMLLLPRFLEQLATCRAAARLGAAVLAPTRNPAAAANQLGNLLDSNQYATAAAAFAHRYRGFDPARQQEEMLRRVTALLN